MQDSESDDSNYRDPMSDDHDEGRSSSSGVVDKEMDDVSTYYKDISQAGTTSSVHSATIGAWIDTCEASCRLGRKPEAYGTTREVFESKY